MVRGKPAQGLAAHRAHRRCGVGFSLRTPLDGLAEQFLDIVSGLNFEMAEVLVTGQHLVLDRTLQRAGRPCGQHRQWFGREDG